jgi:hypothetical protein
MGKWRGITLVIVTENLFEFPSFLFQNPEVGKFRGASPEVCLAIFT